MEMRLGCEVIRPATTSFLGHSASLPFSCDAIVRKIFEQRRGKSCGSGRVGLWQRTNKRNVGLYHWKNFKESTNLYCFTSLLFVFNIIGTIVAVTVAAEFTIRKTIAVSTKNDKHVLIRLILPLNCMLCARMCEARMALLIVQWYLMSLDKWTTLDAYLCKKSEMEHRSWKEHHSTSKVQS